MSYPYDTREDVSREIYSNGWHSEEFRKLYPTWQDFMESDDFDEEMHRLRSKFEQMLLVAGDSFTAEGPHRNWYDHLFTIKPKLNLASNGAGNFYIAQSIKAMVHANDSIKAVAVMWSEMDRLDETSVHPKTKYYSEDGGIQTYRTVEYEQKAVDWLLKTFPMYCVVNTHKKSKWPEVRLKDQRKKVKR